MTKRKLMAVASVMALSMTIFTACGSSSKPSGSGSGSPSGSTWVLGSIVTETGPQAPSTGGSAAVLNAWEKWTNAHGGVLGHPVKVIVLDDQGSAATGLADAHQLVADHVIALVGTASTPEGQWGTYIEQAGIPVIGTGATSGLVWMTNPDFYPLATSPLTEVYASLLAASKAGKLKLANLYCAESPACAQSVPFMKALAPKVGVTVVYSAPVSSTAPSYAAQCLAAQAAGANALFVAADQNTVGRVISDCGRQGVKAIPIGGDGTVSASWVTEPAFQGEVDWQPFIPWNQKNAATADFYSAMQQYASTELNSTRFGANDLGAWASGQVFIDAAKAAGLGDNPTPAEVVNGLTSLHNETAGGLTTPLNFARGVAHVNKCFFLESIQNDHWTQPYGTQSFCQT